MGIGQNELIEHTENCEKCMDRDEIINILQKIANDTIKEKDKISFKYKLIDTIINRLQEEQMDCFNNSLGGYEQDE
jgi:hypothetical protein